MLHLDLPKKQVDERMKQFEKNEMQLKKTRTLWRILVDQFLNPIIYILSASALLAVLFKNWQEGIGILVVIYSIRIWFFGFGTAHKTAWRHRTN